MGILREEQEEEKKVRTEMVLDVKGEVKQWYGDEMGNEGLGKWWKGKGELVVWKGRWY